MKKLVLCGLAGAVVAQIWGTISWMLLPWHNLDFKQFSNDTNVAEVLRTEIQGSGLYMVPNMDPQLHDDEDMMAQWNESARSGPFVFMSVKAEGINPGMGVPMAIGFLLNFIIAATLCWLVSKSSITCPKGQTLFIAVAGTVGALYPHVSNWNWWHFPVTYCLVGIVDLFITWALAGCLMAKLANKLSKAS